MIIRPDSVALCFRSLADAETAKAVQQRCRTDRGQQSQVAFEALAGEHRALRLRDAEVGFQQWIAYKPGIDGRQQGFDSRPRQPGDGDLVRTEVQVCALLQGEQVYFVEDLKHRLAGGV